MNEYELTEEIGRRVELERGTGRGLAEVSREAVKSTLREASRDATSVEELAAVVTIMIEELL